VTTSTLPEYSHDAGEFELVLDATQTDFKGKKNCGKCRGNCVSFILPRDETKVVDFASSETPTYTTPLRPPPRPKSPSNRLSEYRPSPAAVLFPDTPPETPQSSTSSQDHSHETESSPAYSEATTADSESASDDEEYQSATEDDVRSLSSRRRPKPPFLLIRSTLPHGPPARPCQCADPLCPGGELDEAYDAPLPCNCGLPGCLGGDMALAWKLRADGIRKSGRLRHVNDKSVAIHSAKKGIVWGYSAKRV